MSTTPEPVVIRPKGPRIMAGVVVVGAVVCVGFGFALGASVGVAVACLMALLVSCAWLILVNPHVSVEDSRIRVVNPLRTFLVDFSALRAVHTKWTLTLVAADGDVVAWSAPAPGGRSMLAVDANDVARTARSRLPRAAVHPDGSVRPADLAGTDSGDAATVIRSRWEELMESGALDNVSPAPTTAHWNVAAIGAVVMSLLLAVVSILL